MLFIVPSPSPPSPPKKAVTITVNSDDEGEDEAPEHEPTSSATTTTLFSIKSSEKAIKKYASHAVQSRIFEEAWIKFLRIPAPLTSGDYRRVLRRFPQRILPHLKHPILVSDFLLESFDHQPADSSSSFEIPVLALSSLFALIRDHGLDCPEFYVKLYRIIDANVFRSANDCPTFCGLLERYVSEREREREIPRLD